LKVWQKAHALALGVDRVANSSRAPAHSALRSQVIRAAMSIPANIAEGRGRQSDREQIRFLKISIGSCYELEAHLIMSRDVGFIRASDANNLIGQLEEVRKMLFGLIKYLRQS
jgi:four helix bundle protein